MSVRSHSSLFSLFLVVPCTDGTVYQGEASQHAIDRVSNMVGSMLEGIRMALDKRQWHLKFFAPDIRLAKWVQGDLAGAYHT